jgi:hypothetical protein
MTLMAGRNKLVPVLLCLGIIGVLAYYVATRAPATPLHAAQRQTQVHASEVDPDRMVAAARGVRVWPSDATARAALTPNPGDEAELDGIVLAEQFDSLLARARRDPAFEHSLAFALYQCTREDKAAERLDIAIRVGNDERDVRALERFDANFAKCRGLSNAQMAMRFELGEQAARAGVLDAQRHYSSYVVAAISDEGAELTTATIEQYRYNAIAFILAAARSGEPEALYAAHNLYWAGYWVPRDPVRAYRFLERYTRLEPSESAQWNLEWLARQMTPDELRRARHP